MEKEEKTENADVVRLEERTRALEKCDRRHYVMEIILFVAFLMLTLFVVASCDIRTPEKVEEKSWVYTEVVKIDDLTLAVNEDGESVTATAFSRDYTVEKNDTTDIVPLSLTLRITVEEGKITVIRDSDGAAVAYFEYK